MATLASLFFRESFTGLVVVLLVNLSTLLETVTTDRSRRAIRELLAGKNLKAWVLGPDGVKVEVAASAVRVGDTVVVHTGDRIPVDGRVSAGAAAVNQASITGESMPVAKNPGDEVYAGTTVEQGTIWVEALRVGDDTSVGRIIRLVEEAASVRAPIQNLSERFAERVVPVSLAAAGLATPTAVTAAMGDAARRGILIKGGVHLENMGRVDTVLFDKSRGLDLPRREGEAEVLPGEGISCRVGGQKLLAGSEALMAKEGVAVGDSMRPESIQAAETLRAEGVTRLGLEVWGDMKPEQKADLVRRLRSEGRVVAFVGEGINDAAALAAADVGIALGALRLISPLTGAILHNAATLAVVINSARLLRSGGKAGSKPGRLSRVQS